MSMARLIITAVTLEQRTKSEVAREYGVSRYWVQTLVKRFQAEGEAAFEPRSRRPHTSPHAVPVEVEDEIVRLRKELTATGWTPARTRSAPTWPVAPRGRRPRRRPARFPRSRRSGGS
jgi:transposase